jgi:hypothetical protein
MWERGFVHKLGTVVRDRTSEVKIAEGMLVVNPYLVMGKVGML